MNRKVHVPRIEVGDSCGQRAEGSAQFGEPVELVLGDPRLDRRDKQGRSDEDSKREQQGETKQ